MIITDLTRTCKLDGCDNSLFGMQFNTKFCSTPHRRRYFTDLKTAEFAAFREKLVTETAVAIKEAVPTNEIMSEDGTLLYQNYKEPLKPIEPDKGFGYYGTIAMSADRTQIQCHICGKLYKSMGSHLDRVHEIDKAEYKKRYELSASTALVGETIRENMRALAVVTFNNRGQLTQELRDYNEKVKNGTAPHVSHIRKAKNHTLEWRNKRGLCPDQVLEKIEDLIKLNNGRVPTAPEFKAHYKGRYLGSILYQYGSWANAVHKLGVLTAGELNRVDKAKLISDLQAFYKLHKRIPTNSDFNRGLLVHRNVYTRAFGNLNEARIEAGMNALLPAGMYRRFIEVTPDEYYAYKAGHPIPGKITSKHIKQREQKRRKRAVLKLNEGVA